MNKPPDPQNWIYHKLKQPDRQVVLRTEVEKYYKKGWTDRPGKFAMGPCGFIANSILLSWITMKKFWLNHWRWIITTSIAILALYFSLTK